MSASDAATDFTVTMLVDGSREEAFAAINDVRGWWSGEVEGETDRPGAEFTYRYAEVHRSTQRITEMVPGAKVVWRVVDSHLAFIVNQSEWTGTEIVFEVSDRDGRTEVRFTHRGLNPRSECFGACSSGWGALLTGNLRGLIATGAVQPDVFA
jgi:uncharacterized protein YndB with AHSA1/START domain